MAKEQPLGVMIIGGILTVIGGIFTFILFIEIIDSLRFYGLRSLLVDSPTALGGFLLYGVLPVLLYATGVGLSLSRTWARKMCILAIPVLFLFLNFNIACNMAREASGFYSVSIPDLFRLHPEIFLNLLIRYLLLILPIGVYFNLPSIKAHFHETN